MSSSSFRFKRFEVFHDRSSMKVGTDGVLLGAWAKGRGDCAPESILDIGTGSGLIALMLAQRFGSAKVDAIDIDGPSVEQASENFLASPFSERLSAYQSPLKDWDRTGIGLGWKGSEKESEKGRKYDLIVSNPPFFVSSLAAPDPRRYAARHTDTLSYAELVSDSCRLLARTGSLAVVLPADAEDVFVQTAREEGLHLNRVLEVYTTETATAPKRVLMAFSFATDEEPVREKLVLCTQTGERTKDYAALCHEFYL